jgi:hypothetical protein
MVLRKMILDATDENPLGIEWPGSGWAEPGSPIWVIGVQAIYSSCAVAELRWNMQVAHLVASTQKRNKQPPLLVYDYAMGGDTVRGVAIQVRNRFLRGLASRPTAAPWTADDTLFGAYATS